MRKSRKSRKPRKPTSKRSTGDAGAPDSIRLIGRLQDTDRDMNRLVQAFHDAGLRVKGVSAAGVKQRYLAFCGMQDATDGLFITCSASKGAAPYARISWMRLVRDGSDREVRRRADALIEALNYAGVEAKSGPHGIAAIYASLHIDIHCPTSIYDLDGAEVCISWERTAVKKRAGPASPAKPKAGPVKKAGRAEPTGKANGKANGKKPAV